MVPPLPTLGVAPTGSSFEITDYQSWNGRFAHMTTLHDTKTLRRQHRA